MRAGRLIPMFFGIVILLFGIYLVSTNGSVGGVSIPHLLGLPTCTSIPSSNSTGFPSPGGCGFSPFGLGIGTAVVIFGLGLLASSFRGLMASGSMGTGGGGMPVLPPEITATLAMAQSRMQMGLPPAAAPGVKPNTVYCAACGQGNPADAKFCHQCGAQMPVLPSPPSRSA